MFATVDRVDHPPVVGPSTWLPERDLIAVITRIGSVRDRPYPFYDVAVRGKPVARCGTLDIARHAAEAEVGEPMRWEQVSATRHEAWSHRLV